MTTIIAQKNNKGVTMIADSQATDGDGSIWKTATKVVKNGHYLIGGAGDCTALDIATFIWKPPYSVAASKDVNRYMITTVIPSLRKALKDNEYSKDDKDPDSGFKIILVLRNEIFVTDDYWSVNQPVGNVASIGSGSAYALGALSAGASLQKAMEIAEYHDGNTGRPFITINQEKSE